MSPDAGFDQFLGSGDTTAMEAAAPSPAFIATLTKELRGLARQINPGCEVAFVESLMGEGDALIRSGAPDGSKRPVAGKYEPMLRLATVSLDLGSFDPVDTTFHELWHSLEILLTDRERAILHQEYPPSGRRSHEERVAYAFASWATKRHQVGREVYGIFGKVRTLMWRLGHAMQGHGFTDPHQLFEKAYRGKIGGSAQRRRAAERLVSRQPARIYSLGESVASGPPSPRAVRREVASLEARSPRRTLVGPDDPAVMLAGHASRFHTAIAAIAAGQPAGIEAERRTQRLLAALPAAGRDIDAATAAAVRLRDGDVPAPLVASLLPHLPLLAAGLERLEGLAGEDRRDLAQDCLTAIHGDWANHTLSPAHPVWPPHPIWIEDRQRRALGDGVWESLGIVPALAFSTGETASPPVPADLAATVRASLGRGVDESGLGVSTAQLGALDRDNPDNSPILNLMFASSLSGDTLATAAFPIDDEAGTASDAAATMGFRLLADSAGKPSWQIDEIRVESPLVREEMDRWHLARMMLAHTVREGHRVVPGMTDPYDLWRTLAPDIDHDAFVDDPSYRRRVLDALGHAFEPPQAEAFSTPPLSSDLDNNGHWRPEAVDRAADTLLRVLNDAPSNFEPDLLDAFNGLGVINSIPRMYRAVHDMGQGVPGAARDAAFAAADFMTATGGLFSTDAVGAADRAIDSLPLAEGPKRRLKRDVGPALLAASYAERLLAVCEWAGVNRDDPRLAALGRGMIALAGDPARMVTAGNKHAEAVWRRSQDFRRLVASLGLAGGPEGPTWAAGPHGNGHAGDAGEGDHAPAEDYPPAETNPPDQDLPPFQVPDGKAAVSYSLVDTKARNHIIADPAGLGGGGEVERFRRNVEAIRTLKALEADGRKPTAEESRLLAGYTGFGGLSEAAFGTKDGAGLRRLRADLGHLLDDVELTSMRASTPNAHYTDGRIAAAMWRGLAHLGLERGRALEPSAGPGWFLGLQPEDMRDRVATTAVELDSVSGRIARLLYPRTTVHIGGFEQVALPDNFHDAVIGNVPFGRYGVADPAYSHLSPSIHDWFLLKAVDRVRPGGVVAVLTSRYTLDKAEPAIREALRDKATLLTCLRLPNGTHAQSAGTDAVTDLMVLQKRPVPLSRLPAIEARRILAGEEDWVSTKFIRDPLGGEPLRVNATFIAHPDRCVGRMERSGTLVPAKKGKNSQTCEKSLGVSFDGGPDEIAARVAAAFAALSAGLMKGRSRSSDGAARPIGAAVPDGVKSGAWFVDSRGRLRVAKEGVAVQPHPRLTPDEEKLVRGAIDIRDAVRDVLASQQEGRSAPERDEARRRLNQTYDAFRLATGPLRSRKLASLLAGDPDAPLLFALEEGGANVKAKIFSEDVIAPAAAPDRADSIEDAAAISLSERGYLDKALVARLMSLPVARAETALLEGDLAFRDPELGGDLVPADQYLSGDISRRLAAATLAAQSDESYAGNIAALTKVMPAPVPWHEIGARFGSSWIPPDDIRDFLAREALGIPKANLLVGYNPADASWRVEILGKPRSNWGLARWGVKHVGALKLIQDVLNSRPLVVSGANGVDQAATREINVKAAELQALFAEWLWKDDGRRQRLAALYNGRFNTMVPRRFDGGHLRLPGMSPEWRAKLRPVQKNAIWRCVQDNTVVGHEVGIGKTGTLIAAAIEGSRLGRLRKPIIAIHKPTADSFAATAREMYPGARILAWPAKETVSPAERAEFWSRVVTGDWDAVLVTHDALDLLPVTPETQTKYLRHELGLWRSALQNARDQERESGAKRKSRTVKDIETSVARLEARLKTLHNEGRKDCTVYFEDLGSNAILVDELHKYKNLAVASRMGQVKGLPSGESQRAAHLFLITSLLHDSGGRVIGATGTPVANSLAELHSLQRYQQPAKLRELGVNRRRNLTPLRGEIGVQF